MPLEKMRGDLPPDVGGGFGTKLFPYREYALIAVAAKKLRKTIKWNAATAPITSSRRAGPRQRSRLQKMALAEDGKFLAMGRRFEWATWARICRPSTIIFPMAGAGMLPGSLTTSRPSTASASAPSYTNTVPVDAYRGAGRPEAALCGGALVDAAARKLALTPDAIRRKNFIPPKAHALPRPPPGKGPDEFRRLHRRI